MRHGDRVRPGVLVPAAPKRRDQPVEVGAGVARVVVYHHAGLALPPGNLDFVSVKSNHLWRKTCGRKSDWPQALEGSGVVAVDPGRAALVPSSPGEPRDPRTREPHPG